MIEYYSIHVLFYKARSTGNSPDSYRRGKKTPNNFLPHSPARPRPPLTMAECPERRRPVLPSPTRRPDLHPRAAGPSPRAPLDLAPECRRPDLAHVRRQPDLVPTRAASSPRPRRQLTSPPPPDLVSRRTASSPLAAQQLTFPPPPGRPPAPPPLLCAGQGPKEKLSQVPLRRLSAREPPPGAPAPPPEEHRSRRHLNRGPSLGGNLLHPVRAPPVSRTGAGGP
jgi:hypothetical protein